MVGEFADLGPAAETVCDDERFRIRTADRRPQLVFGARHRHVVVPFLEAEIPGQSTTSGIEHLDVDANYPDPAGPNPGLTPHACGYREIPMCTDELLQPLLPDPRGPLSGVVIELLGERLPSAYLTRIQLPLGEVDPFGIDLQLALYVCYELHYRGFADTDEKWEWNPALLDVRHCIEDRFLAAVRRLVGDIPHDASAQDELDRCESAPVDRTSLSVYMRDRATWPQKQEYFAHRSLYHLKEADPQSWVIPRLTGRAKAAFVAVEYDEYGGGGGYRTMHQRLFADLLGAAGMSDNYCTISATPRVPRWPR